MAEKQSDRRKKQAYLQQKQTKTHTKTHTNIQKTEALNQCSKRQTKKGKDLEAYLAEGDFVGGESL